MTSDESDKQFLSSVTLKRSAPSVEVVRAKIALCRMRVSGIEIPLMIWMSLSS
ncbi:hypothetical protein [Ferrithrix thermotolerans]|uniref:hypothetical protein n=1 Tax=Ferrithrix thermotolerans TaxID=209649 RepID=UPI0015BC3F08|nr:hypothetical protein [Ferrithrix thermotolerans]